MSTERNPPVAPDEPSTIRSFSHHATQFFAPLQREIDRAFSEFGRGLDRLDVFAPIPSIDFAETKDGIEITVELPGLTKKDIHLAVEDDVLTVSGEKRAEKKQEGKDFRFVERRFGAFSRSISLPRGIDAGQIKAEMRDGLLKVTAPRPGHGDGNKVEVTIA
ncbi:MAG: Hsp20/alpha crystallin family protein [Brevundimonas sp.]|uniref:Hsp20/alpha crystallin family protein n=1 Tax=Brevundimonas sp. TaxID=1871086 RepID=UPI0022C8B17F|nr:Hsp20/alpha crystallin family protein [Brevundimonas sp.]MCZ8086779.1 Hsp20/alpha crystallin family protein [Brevundimonas sp.]MCZ8194199.1 Hsp20/alpha crystallin family protein [Brevundimonas sp.]